MKTRSIAALLLGAILLALAPAASAHCDSVNGPVVQAARSALEAGEITPLLRWVKPEQEKELRAAVTQALAARRQGGAAAALAQRYFSETAVRLHRAGEGAAYSGLKDSPVPPEIAAVDSALDNGTFGPVSSELGDAIAAALRRRFAAAAAARAHAGESVAAGRAYVAAYVELVHYAEAVHALASGHAESPHSEPARE